MVKVCLLLLPPEGVRAEPWIAREVEDAWETAAVSVQVLGGERKELEAAIRKCTGRRRCDAVLTVGRSGHLRGDFTPDETRRLLERRLPGIEERMYLAPPRRPEDLLFRGAAGIRGSALVINLPSRRGRVRAVLRFLAPVLGHALEKIAGDPSECALP